MILYRAVSAKEKDAFSITEGNKTIGSGVITKVDLVKA